MLGLDRLQLEDADESIEVQVPDFHYDWGVKDRTKHDTPSPQQSVAHSSASSGHVLTDASTISGSSLPTPPDTRRRFQRVV